jgi:hypothetical protein
MVDQVRVVLYVTDLCLKYRRETWKNGPHAYQIAHACTSYYTLNMSLSVDGPRTIVHLMTVPFRSIFLYIPEALLFLYYHLSHTLLHAYAHPLIPMVSLNCSLICQSQVAYR